MHNKNAPILSDTDHACFMIMDKMSEGALVLTDEGTIAYCNQTFARMLSIAVSQVEGHDIFCFMQNHDGERLRHILSQHPHDAQIEIALINCERKTIQTLFSIGELKHGSLPSAYVVVKDLSVSSKTFTLEDKTRLLAEANKDLALFAAVVAHDLRSPIRHIRSFTELLLEHLQSAVDEDSKHYLDVITNATTEMNTIVDRLLYWTSVGNSDVYFSRVDLNVLVRNVVNALTQEAADRNIEWDIDDFPPVYGESNMLQTALTCVISNALRFTQLQPISRIKIANEPQTSNLSNLVLSIKDNGVGFATPYHETKYDVSQELYNQEAFEGTGIGLATVKRIMQRHSGNYWATSKLNQGAIFYLEIPLYLGL